MRKNMYTNVVSDPLKIEDAFLFLNDDTNLGGLAILTGVVCDHNRGKTVTSIYFDIQDNMVKKFLNTVCNQVHEKWGNEIKLYIVHRKNNVKVGEMAFIAAAGSPRRIDSFDKVSNACNYIVEQIKQRALIWKHEHYVDNTSEWLPGCSVLGDSNKQMDE